MQTSLLVVILGISMTYGMPADQCSVPDPQKVDCGYLGIDQQGCEAKGCCWQPAQGNDIPWCFYKGSGPSPPTPPTPPSPPTPTPPAPPTPSSCPLSYNFSSTSAPFSSTDAATMLKYFLANTDIQGQGGVVASPDHSTPGGSYYYAWERDGALSMRALLDVTPFGQDSETRFQHYTQWVLKVQNEKDPNGIDVRTEPKYNLPAGDVFTDGWCRPQTDGPGLRAKTLMAYAEKLMAAGKNDDVKQYLWTGDESKYNGGAIKYDLDWVADNWESDGCDLWEEIRSNDFFWNRFMFRAAMHIGAKFASTMGDSASSSKYSAAAQKLDDAVQSHWNGNFVYETDQRQKDAAVFEGFNHGDLGDGVFGPTSKEVAGTVSTLAELFCNNFAVNGADTKAGVPGVLIGRYDGDHYAGGNPWHLLTASLAQILYRGASESLNAHMNNSTSLDAAGVDAWKEVLGISQDVELSGLAQSMAGAGDGVLTRLKKHVSGDNNNLHMAEQLDRNTGVPMSAKDLTWSYANVLSAVHSRQQFVDLLEASQM